MIALALSLGVPGKPCQLLTGIADKRLRRY